MLGKYRLKPSFLLEIAFLIGVWLIAWLVFDAPLAVIVFAIFAAYALIFAYENWLDNVSQRERSEARRSRRKESEAFGSYARTVESSRPRPSVALDKPSTTAPAPTAPERPSKPTPAPAAHSISERLSAKLHSRESREEAPRTEQASEAAAVKRETTSPAKRTSLEAPPARVETEETRRPEPQPPGTREEPAPVAATEGAPHSVSEALSSPRREPVSERPHSRMAEIAAGPDARKAAGPIGGWNIWQLERLLAAQAKPDPERDYERSMMLVYLRDFADSDGQLPPQFDELVRESFGDLVHGPAS